MPRSLTVLSLFLAASLAHSGAADERFLKTHGNEIRDAAGKTVLLRGVNLGGWLVFEPWMCPMDSSGTLKDHSSAEELLVKRFGEATADSLVRTYQDHWITAKDLDNIAAQGMNVIRVPFWYRNLQTEDGAWISGGLDRLDWVVAEAWKRGIYSILDFHGTPGGQTKGESTGKQRKNAELWGDEANILRTAAIWRKIAEHYQGNPAVAAYDLLNEPSDAPSLGALWTVYDRIFREIRQVDPDHMITVEGCINTRIGKQDIHWGWEALPHPDFFGWKNIIYQMHHYEWDWNDAAKQRKGVDFQVSEWKKANSLGVPMLMGEFNLMASEDAWHYALEQFNSAGVSWTFWSYKATHGTGSDSWGLYNPVKKDAPNLLTDDAATIRAKWQAVETGTSFALNPTLDRILKAALKPLVPVTRPTPSVSSNP